MDENQSIPETQKHKPPEPEIEMVFWSFMVILGCSLLVIAAILLIAMDWRNPFVVIISVMSLTYCPMLGLAQYGATFRRSAWSAAAVSFLLRILGGFWLVAYLILSFIGLILGAGLDFAISTLPWIILPVICLLFTMYMNYRWRRTLDPDCQCSLTEGRQPWQISTREIFLATAVVAVISAVATGMIRSWSSLL